MDTSSACNFPLTPRVAGTAVDRAYLHLFHAAAGESTQRKIARPKLRQMPGDRRLHSPCPSPRPVPRPRLKPRKLATETTTSLIALPQQVMKHSPKKSGDDYNTKDRQSPASSSTSRSTRSSSASRSGGAAGHELCVECTPSATLDGTSSWMLLLRLGQLEKATAMMLVTVRFLVSSSGSPFLLRELLLVPVTREARLKATPFVLLFC